jgi:hypothetical protein
LVAPFAAGAGQQLALSEKSVQATKTENENEEEAHCISGSAAYNFSDGRVPAKWVAAFQ